MKKWNSILLQKLFDHGERVMNLPIQATPVVRHRSTDRHERGLTASDCSVWKKIACGGAIVACGAVCVGTIGTACVECLAGIGASGCIDCF
jgi:hypothetical protein